jgi:hypothetical protein
MQPSSQPTSIGSKNGRVAATAIIWGCSTGMLAIGLPLSGSANRAVIVIAIAVAAAVSTMTVWLSVSRTTQTNTETSDFDQVSNGDR